MHLSREKGRVRAVGWAGRRAAPPAWPGLGPHPSQRVPGPAGTALSGVRHPPVPLSPAKQPVLQHWGWVSRPRVFLVSILEGFAVKIALAGVVELQKLVCCEAAGGTRPPPRACWPEVAGAGGQGHVRAPSQVTAATVSLRSLELALEQPPEEQAQEHHPKPERAGGSTGQSPFPPGAGWWAPLLRRRGSSHRISPPLNEPLLR